MSAKSFATQLRLLVEDVKSKGTVAINCDNLINYLKEVESSPEAELSLVDLEKYKADLQNWIELNKYSNESNLEMFRSVITSGQSAIKSSFLLNGGAALATLAFIGHLVQFNLEKVAIFGNCLLPFTYGVLSVAVTSGFTYLSQWFYASDNAKVLEWNLGFKLNVVCILLGLSSYGFFVWGLCLSYKALSTYSWRNYFRLSSSYFFLLRQAKVTKKTTNEVLRRRLTFRLNERSEWPKPVGDPLTRFSSLLKVCWAAARNSPIQPIGSNSRLPKTPIKLTPLGRVSRGV